MFGNHVAVILSGCGVFDGAEINEVVLSLLALEEKEIKYQCFAPNINQMHVIDHATGHISDEVRNVLSESARIVRGEIEDLVQLNASNFDALLIPGGFGVAKNLSNFASEGGNFEIASSVKVVLQEFADANKPAGYMCIAPALLPKVYQGITCTIGEDSNTAEAIEANGGEHQRCSFDDVVIDNKAKVVSTPAYMLAKNRAEAKKGIDKLVSELIKLTNV